MCGALRWGKTWCFHAACHRSSAALMRPYRSKHSLLLLSAVLRACVRMWVCHNSNTKNGQDGWKAAGTSDLCKHSTVKNGNFKQQSARKNTKTTQLNCRSLSF